MMKRIRIVFSLVFVLVFSGMSFALSGNGTESSPYLISSAADLKAFAEKVNHKDKEVAEVAAWAKLTADIDLNPGKTILNSDGTLYNNGADLEQWVRIGAYTTRHYAGTFDGQGHTISGVYINASALDYVGLFGFIGEGGLVKNFGVKNSYICGRAFVGGIVAVNNGTVRDVHYEGTLIGTESNVGGVAGTNAGAISNVYKTGLVKHGNFGDWASSIGGVVGYNLGTVTGSYNTGDVIVSSYSESGQNVGGVVGANSGTVSDVYNTGSVSVKNTLSGYGGQNIGGVVGKNEVGDNKGSGVVNGAYNAGTVSGANIVGGVVGLNEKSAEVRNVYNIGAVDGGWRPVSMLVTFVIGGLIGYNYGYATLAYNNGVVTSSGYYGNDGAVGAGNNVSFGYYNMEECPDCQANGSYGLETLDLASLDVAKLFPGSEKTWIPGSVKQISLTEYKIQLPGILNLGVQPEMVYKFEPNADGVYEIKSAQQLRLFAKLVNSGKNSIKGKLVRDIVLNSEVYFLEVPQWDPIGTYGHPFIGSFDGDGHTIEGLYFDNVNQNYVGLFGYVGSNGEVKKVSLKNSHIKGNVCVGGIAGTSNGAITGVSNASGVSGVEDVGGIVGCNDGLVRDVHNTGSVNGDDEIGGVVGLNDAEGEVSDASNAGVMQGGQGVGGVIGTNRGSVSKAYNARTVHGTNATGGVIGDNEGSVNSVYNEGTLNGDKGITGGVVGINDGGSISDAFNTGAVEKAVYSTSWVGGVVGSLISGSVKNVYNTGLVSDNFAVNEVPVAGVVVGRNVSGTIENAYYNTDLACSDCNTSFGTGKTTVELASKTLLTGFSSSIWGVGSGEPVVEEEKLVYKLIYLKGVGTQPEVEYAEFQPNASGVYEISTAKELFLFAEIVNKSKKAVNGKLTRDIVLNKDVLKADGSLSGNYASFTRWTPIGTKNNPFIGQFDGDGNAVYGLYFSDVNKDTVGLFGYVGINGKVMNVGVKDSYIEGGDYVGGVVGFNDGSVSKVYNEGTMKGGSYVGGVVGAGSVSEAYNTGSVSGSGYVGGVVGAGSVSEAYNTGLVNGSSNVGGVIGESQKAVENAYNTGSVSGSGCVGGVVGCNAGNGSITNVYSVGDVHLIKKSAYNANLAGLVIGSAVSSKVKNAYYSKEVVCENCGTLSLGTEMSIAELTNGALPAGFSSDIWVAGSVESLLDDGKLKCLLPGLRNVDTQLEFVYSFQSGAEDVLEISSAEQLYWFAKVVNFGKNSIKAKLTANIEVNQNVLKDDGSLSENYSSFKKWTPIGTFENPFLGTFDGQNYTISGLYFDNEKQDYAGLFGYVGSDGKVMNVGVEKSYIKGNAFVGGVVGTNMGSVKGVYNTGSVNGGDEIGGVAGHNGGSVSDAHNAGLVNGKAQVGGVVGTNDVNGLVNTVYNKGTVDGVQVVGGVIGDNRGTVDNAYNDNFVNGTGTNIGGVVGYNDGGSVNSVHNAGELSAVGNVGGVAGILMSGSIKDAYNVGKMSCKTGFIGGVVGGMLDGSVENAYNQGSMSGYSAIGIYAGGVVGKMAGGSVNKAYNAGSVYDGAEIVGGLVGFMDGGSVENAYNTGSMSGSFETVGGLVGSMRGGSVKYAYNTGLVSGGKNVAYVVGESTSGKIENAYYNKDVECSKCNTSSGTGKTSAELASKTLLTGFSKDIWEGGSDSPVISGVKLVYKLTYLKEVGSQPEIEYADFQPNEDGVFEISSVQQLYWFAELVNSDNGSFKGKLTKSIVVNEKVLTEEGKLSENYPSFKKWTPIGTFENPFLGTFDGQNYTISGLYFNDMYKSGVGLFGFVGAGGVVQNVGVEDSFIKGEGNVGGVVGRNEGTLSDVHYSGMVVGYTDCAGGVVGSNNGSVSNAYKTGAVSSTGDHVGGIVGWTTMGSISNVYNTGTVSGTGDYVGGVAGENSWGGTVEKAYNTGSVDGANRIGGVIGYNSAKSVFDVFNTGAVSGSGDYVGGLVGFNYNTSISSAYSFGTVSGSGSHMGFVIGWNNGGDIENSYYNSEAICSNCNKSDVKGITAMKLTLSTLPAGFSSDIWVAGSVESLLDDGKLEGLLPGLKNVGSRPKFAFEIPLSYVYEISNADQLYWFAKVVNVGRTTFHAELTADIVVNKNVLKADGSLSDDYKNFIPWTPIGSYQPYTGNFDGAGHTISGLYFDDVNQDNVGLFGYVGSPGQVENVGVEDSYFRGHWYVGGVVGYNRFSIINVYNTGVVKGNYYVGGVIGYNSQGYVNDVYNTGLVVGDSDVGGVSGYWHSGSISNVYNSGLVSGTGGNVGRVIGYKSSGSVTNAYYNSDIACSSCNNSIGTGKTAVELANTILPNGFSSEVWGVGSGQLVVSNGKLVYKLPYLLNVGNQHEFAVLQPNAEGVFEISSAQELTWFAKLVNSGETSIKGKLTQNIVVNQNVLNANGSLNTGNLSNFSIWTPIGTQNQPFNGSFDGAGYTISGLYVLGDYYAGLFGYVGSSGKVEKVGIEKSYVSGKYYVGSIVGYNNGAVRNVYNTSVVSESSDYVGGVAGYVSASGSVENAYSTGSVSGTGDYIGGAIGKNDGSVSNVYYSTDVVSSSASIEGVTGLTSAKLASKTLPEGFSSDIWVPGSGEPVVSDGKKVYKLPGFVASGTQPEIGWVFGPNADGIYEISSANELSKFAKIVNGGQTSVKGKLTANIVVNKNVLKADGSLSGNSANFTQWTPIGTSENPFVGTFDGAGYTVSGLYINEAKANYVGLFGSVGSNNLGSKGKVMNVGVEDSYFMGEKLVGGVVGYNTGSVSKVYNTGSVNGTELVGGVVGLNIAEISDVYNTGSVEGTISIGGVAGGSDGSIVNAYNTGSVAGSNEVGGVAGYNAGNISNSFFNKEVYTGNAVGSGNAGTNVLGKTTAELASKTLPDGFSSSVWVAGSGEPVISNGRYVYRLPGLAGVGSRPKVEYADFQTNSDGVYEISSALQLNMFAQLVNKGGTLIKGKLTANIVLNKNVLNADGSLNRNSANFTQWTPIGTSDKPFAGTFDGNGHTVSGLYFNDASTNYVGFFGYVDSTGKIMNVGVEDSYITGKNYVGGIVGYSKKGVISGVYNTGSVNGGDYVGGVAGRLSVATVARVRGDFAVSNVYNTGSVNGFGSVGGVVGVVSAPFASGTGRLTQSDFAYAVDNAYNIGEVNSSLINGGGRIVGQTSMEGVGVEGREPTFKITHAYYSTDAVCTKCANSNGTAKSPLELVQLDVESAFSNSTGVWTAGSIDNSGDHITYNYPRLTVFGDRSQPKSSPAIVFAADNASATIYGAATDPVNITSDIEVTGPVSLKRSFPNVTSADAFSTVMLPFSPKSKPSGVAFYTFASVNQTDGKWTVSVRKVNGNLEANTPYLVKAASGTTSIDFADGGTFKVTVGDHLSTEGNWKLVGTYEYKQWLEDDPGLGSDYGFAGSKDNDPSIVGQFKKVGAGAYLYPMRAYLKYTAPAAVRQSTSSNKSSQNVSASLPESMDVVLIEDSESGEQTTKVIGTLDTRTGELKASEDRYFDMKGRYLGKKKPKAKGVYNNGKKQIVK